jgi:exoribonuclease R
MEDVEEVEKERVIEEECDEETLRNRVNIVELINSQNRRRVTATVVGILKPMNKTYGGSIVKESQMVEETKRKFELFCINFGIL